jgi:hypothetical protein
MICRIRISGGNMRLKLASTLVLTLASFALSACAPAKSAILPDEPISEKDRASEAAPAPPAVTDAADLIAPAAMPNLNPWETQAILDRYIYLDPQSVVPADLLQKAIVYFDANKSHFGNQTYITVVDFSKSSAVKRMFVINMNTGFVTTLHVAHGKGSEPTPVSNGYARRFSNVLGSNESSLGFFRTAETYFGKHALSLRIDGLSTTNSNVRVRAVVVHGADYVHDADVIEGRTDGCFGVPMSQKDALIALIKGGSMIYADVSKN